MNIFIVCHSTSAFSGQLLIGQLSRIGIEPRKTVPVIIVDEPHTLEALPISSAPVDYTSFSLGHFGSGDQIACESIALHMDTVVTDWVLIEFGQHDQSACIDFIVKLSRYNYLSDRLRHCNLVFSASAISLGILARTLNESFNNLPVGNAGVNQVGQLRRLFIITHIKRVLISLPLPRGLLHRCHTILRRIYRRLLSDDVNRLSEK